MKKIFLSLLTLVVVFGFGSAVSASTLVKVYGNTSAGENQSGWLFNRDLGTATPFEFNSNQASIGVGSLYVLPIGGTNASDKFIAENFINEPIANINSISYDFMIGGGGSTSDENEFYMNVYANFGESDDLKYYDCRYNVVPIVGSTSGFTTVTFDPNVPYPVTKRSSSPYNCPSIPAEMDLSSSGSNIRVFALNVGDTSLNDHGLDGYIDNVVVDLESGITTYDFEPFIATAEITSPSAGVEVSGIVNFAAEYIDQDGNDAVQWAVRKGICAAGTNTVYGNVDGKNTSFDWNGSQFSANIDMTHDVPGLYCFIFNPTEDKGDTNLRITRWFKLVAPAVPLNKEECKKDGWKLFNAPTFKNQGACVSYLESNEKAGKRD